MSPFPTDRILFAFHPTKIHAFLFSHSFSLTQSRMRRIFLLVCLSASLHLSTLFGDLALVPMQHADFHEKQMRREWTSNVFLSDPSVQKTQIVCWLFNLPPPQDNAHTCLNPVFSFPTKISLED